MAIEDIAGDHGGMLAVGAIDKLIERINCGPERPDLSHDADCTYRLGHGAECSCDKDSRPESTPSPEPKIVYITVVGGVADIGHAPKGVKVEIIDYDNLQTGGKAEFDKYPDGVQQWIIEHNAEFLQDLGINTVAAEGGEHGRGSRSSSLDTRL